MFYLTKTVVRIATPLIYPIIVPIVSPAIQHAVGCFKPIEADFDFNFDRDYCDNPLAVGIAKVVEIVDGVRKLVEAVVKAPVGIVSRVVEKSVDLAKPPLVVISRVVDYCQQQIKAVVKAPFVVTSRVFNKSVNLLMKLNSAGDEPIAVVSQMVKEVAGVIKHFVPSFLLRTVRTYIGTKNTNPADRWWIRPDEAKLKAWLSTDNARTSAIAKGNHSVKNTPSSAYPSPPPSIVDPSSPPGGITAPRLNTTSTTQDTNISTCPRSEETIPSLDLGSPISSLNLGESLGSLTSLTASNGLTNGKGNDNGNDNKADSDDSSDTASISSSLIVNVPGFPEATRSEHEFILSQYDFNYAFEGARPASIPVNDESTFSEIALPNYSPSYGGGSSNANTSDPERFSENEDEAVNRARAIAFRPDHEEADRLDSSLEQIPQ
ncbi:hypothetical protein SMACR_00594 [Sordaria macrospora]|uniref:WGS project CABT00000000 data, contig 2.1 n=2 Tax=Sordaria macrospora TaxID=5147 RepID=F7VLK2_SORMK|nr:uncharacterized protein SMAC_00594 [Sordaria macrospora k-hell]KAA8628032.1 hypothetical protein SMACR_00594 [Sordaria macrospora]KAH7627431.1 hypothetical protein B0T09DRAFT_269682 [Sordaria sp. MPI-SDFR-AT-0083]CCC06380.1 unnamed protein product [Sordaria macrospora k-hell]